MTDPIETAAQFLTQQLPWLRHATDEHGQPYAPAVFDAIAECAGRMRSLVDGPAAQKYLGPCGAALTHDNVFGEPIMTDCDGDIYGRVYADGTTARTGACRTCRATVDTDERQAWLDGEVRGHAFRAAEIAQAYGIRANTIRVWATRGVLVAHGHDRDGRPLYNVGDVLDLAAGDAARRAEEHAKRARRAAAKVAEDERLSA